MIRFTQTREITEYKSIINGLLPDFDYIFLHTLLQWCKIADDPFERTGQFWEVYLIRYRFSKIGICGLYSLNPGSTDELWLGWFGLVPNWRNKGHGKSVLDFLEEKAREQECKRLYSYVDKEAKPLNFYLRNGFKVFGTVKEYLDKLDQKVDGSNFENPDDLVIVKELTY